MLLNCTHDEDFFKIYISFTLKSASTTYIFPADAENKENKRCQKKDWFDISVLKLNIPFHII